MSLQHPTRFFSLPSIPLYPLYAKNGFKKGCQDKKRPTILYSSKSDSTSLPRWLFSNTGNEADCQLEKIHNYTLNFLH